MTEMGHKKQLESSSEMTSNETENLTYDRNELSLAEVVIVKFVVKRWVDENPTYR